MTDYGTIKKMCLQRGEPWEDPDFPATQSSVFYHQTPPFHFVWKRAREVYTNPIFIHEKCEAFDVIPGKLGDKWLVSCLGVLYLCKGLFQKVVPPGQRMEAPYTGIYRFRLWWCGQWQEVLVDDQLPTVNGKLAFLQPSHSCQMWPALLEKAYAKLHGSYEALKYGTMLDGLADLTGGITEAVQLLGQEHLAAQLLESLLATASVVTAHHSPAVYPESFRELELEMNYRIYYMKTVESSNGYIPLVMIRRPPKPGETQLFHIIDHDTWKTIPAFRRDELMSQLPGTWMLFSDFVRQFTKLEAVHLDAETSREEPSLADKVTWHLKMHQGAWRRGLSAGGCRNFNSKTPADFFHLNPQLQLLVGEEPVLISLNQHGVMEPKVIGFSIYRLPKSLSETASPAFFKKVKSTANSQYTNSRQVSERWALEAGAYLVIPTTFEPRAEAKFSLRVISSVPVQMKVLDYQPQMVKSALVKAPPGMEASSFAQYEAVFLQLADEHRTLDAFELQELLDACLPNDYIKSCASIETCRQIVLSMDKNGNGRITLSDFKDLMCSLKHWQLVFKSHAREKMGVLIAERLRDALREVGFVVPEQAMAQLILRYMRKDGMLRFGDFVSSVMHLHRAFNVYNTHESPLTEAMTVSLSEWLKCALMC